MERSPRATPPRRDPRTPPAALPSPARPRCCYRGLLGAPRASSEGWEGGRERCEVRLSAAPPTFTPNPERSGLGGRRWSSWEVRRLLAGGSFPDLLKGGKKNNNNKKTNQCLYLRTSPICKEDGLPAACRLGSSAPLSFYEAASSRGAVKHPQVCALSGSRAEPAVPLGSFPIWQQLQESVGMLIGYILLTQKII